LAWPQLACLQWFYDNTLGTPMRRHHVDGRCDIISLYTLSIC